MDRFDEKIIGYLTKHKVQKTIRDGFWGLPRIIFR